MALAVPGAVAEDILRTSGFSNCGANPTVEVNKMEITYNASNRTVIFDVSGSSNKVQNVTAALEVTAYGQSVFSNKFNPCSPGTFVSQLCPGVCYLWWGLCLVCLAVDMIADTRHAVYSSRRHLLCTGPAGYP